MRFGRLSRSDGAAVFARLDEGRAQWLERAPWLDLAASGGEAWSEADLLCPVEPSKIVAVGRNYTAHARELGNEPPQEPLLFLKPPSALIGPGESVILPEDSARVEHEAELGVVIGRRARNVRRADALAFVFGYTCVCDVSARDLQRKDGQWTRAKGFDTFCPAGPWIETELDPANAIVECIVNGEVRQRASTASMIFDVPTLVSYVSHVMTLEPGDLLATGTPAGVGPLIAGDALEVRVEGVGTLRLRVT